MKQGRKHLVMLVSAFLLVLLCMFSLVACFGGGGNKMCEDGKHEFESLGDGNLVCKICGYSEKCGHESTKWEAYNSTWHVKVCTVCGMNLAQQILNNVPGSNLEQSDEFNPELIGKHDGDPCTVCGFTVYNDGTFCYLEKDTGYEAGKANKVYSWVINGLVSTAARDELTLPDTFEGSDVTGFTPAFIRAANAAGVKEISFGKNNASCYNNEAKDSWNYDSTPDDKFTAGTANIKDGTLSTALNNRLLDVFAADYVNVKVGGEPLTELTADETWVNAGATQISIYAWKIAGLKKITVSGVEEVSITANSSVEKVVIGEGVKKLESLRAFSYEDKLENLAEIELPDSLTSFGSGVFRRCVSLRTINIPAGVTEIPNYAFDYCYSLREITIGASVTRVGDSAFADCTALNKVTFLGEDVTLGTGVFSNCYSLMEVHLPSALRELPSNTFYNNYMLLGITLPETLETIGYNAFYHCANFRTVTIPASVKSIDKDEYLFKNCISLQVIYNLSSVDIGNSVPLNGTDIYVPVKTKLPETPIEAPTVVTDERDFVFLTPAGSYTRYLIGYAGVKNDMKELILPDGYPAEGGKQSYTVANFAFEWCGELRRLLIPAGVKSLEKYAFDDYSGGSAKEIICLSPSVDLTDFSYIYKFTSIADVGEWVNEGDCLFYVEKNGTPVLYSAPYQKLYGDDGLLKSVTYLLPESFRGGRYAIGQRVLTEDKVAEFVFPAAVSELRDYACEPYYSPLDFRCLKSIVFLGTDIKIGRGAFDSRTYEDNGIVVKNLVIPDGAELSDRALGDGYGTDNLVLSGTLTIGKNVKLGERSLGDISRVKTITIGEGSTLGKRNFSKLSGISITLPSDLREIGEHSFEGCTNLKNFVIPDSVEVIGAWAFWETDFKKLTLPSSLREIGDYAFQSSKITTLTLPDGVESIGEGAFGYSDLASISLSTSLRTIGAYAFSNTKITAITLPEGLETIGDYAFCGLGITGITLPSTLRAIGDSAFAETSLTALTLPEGLETIGADAFHNIPATSEILLPESLVTVGSWAFGCDGNMPEAARNRLVYTYVENKPKGFATQIADNFSYGGKPGAVGDYEFVVGKTTAKFIKYNGSDTVLVIPDTCDGKPVTGIRSGALDNLRNVTGITVPATVTGFDGDLFKNCTSLESFNYEGTAPLTYEMFANTLYRGTADGAYMYIGTTVTGFAPDAGRVARMREGTTRIADSALAKTGNARILIIPASVTDFGKNSFNDYTDSMEIYIEGQPEKAPANTGNAYYYTNVTITVDGLIFRQDSLSGGPYNISLIRYIGTATEITVPATVDEKSVTYIGAAGNGGGVGAFRGCDALTKVTFSSMTLDLSAGTFYGCTSLRTVDFGENIQMLTLSSSAIENSAIESIILPDGYVAVRSAAPIGSTVLTKTKGNGATLLAFLKDTTYTAQNIRTWSKYDMSVTG